MVASTCNAMRLVRFGAITGKMLIHRVLAVVLLLSCAGVAFAAYNENAEAAYLSNWDLLKQSYTVPLPSNLQDACASKGAVTFTTSSNVEITPTNGNSIITSDQLQQQCGASQQCNIAEGVTVRMTGNLNVGAIVNRGVFVWDDTTQTAAAQFLCAGAFVMEDNGVFKMNVANNRAFIYIKDNEARHPRAGFRALAGVHTPNVSRIGFPQLDIAGRSMPRTWSVLSRPVSINDTSLYLIHNVVAMGWRVGDRIAISPTAQGNNAQDAQAFWIAAIEGTRIDLASDESLTTRGRASQRYMADHSRSMEAEVINLSRNVIITGDDFRHVPCAGSDYCTCDATRTRSTCTLGLHTMMHGSQVPNGGTYRIQYTRVEKCGQRGVLGRYCLHFHLIRDCKDCLAKGNAIEFSQQRGVVIHGTHLTSVEENVLYDVRGGGIYIEDGNELGNNIRYNTVICPNRYEGPKQGCTVPGTDNGEADASPNHAAFWALSHSNNFVGNHAGNNFNGIFYHPSFAPNGRGTVQGRVCSNNLPVGRFEGNVLHGNGRFGTYFVASSWPRRITQSLATNGFTSSCHGFGPNGEDRGYPVALVDNVDYHNSFIGSYALADVQFQNHVAIESLNLIYHKETKNFADGCAAHFTKHHFEGPGTLSLANGPATIVFEDCTFTGPRLHLHMNHHCDLSTEGGSGSLCNSQYMLVRPKWSVQNDNDWIDFGGDDGTYTHGGMLVLSPEDAANPNGVVFPAGFQGVVDGFHSWLLALDGGNTCVNSSSLGAYRRWHQGILCRKPLRRLNIYTFGVDRTTAGYLQIDAYQSGNFVSRGQMRFSRSYFSDGRMMGYAVPIVAGAEFEYRISFPNGSGIPEDWVIEFSDPVIGNRWTPDVVRLVVAGRNCPTLTTSQHDRRWILASMDSSEFLQRRGRGACSAYPDMPTITCAAKPQLKAAECPELCNTTCNNGYCDCYTGSCACKAGFTGANCEFDICATARCGPHGKCKARYLGGLLPVSESACICEPGWAGPTCEINVCSGVSCNGRGSCRAFSEKEAYCACDTGYYGKFCERTCVGYCQGGGGTWPFGCNAGIPRTGAYCGRTGGCSYIPFGNNVTDPNICCINTAANDCDFCANNPCPVPDNDCKVKGACINGTCQAPTDRPEGSVCQTALYGRCQGGVCVASIPPPVAAQTSPSARPQAGVIPPTTLTASRPSQQSEVNSSPRTFALGVPAVILYVLVFLALF